MSDAKADTVQGLGFKDKDKALETIKILEGRDPDYQKLAIKGLIGRAKRVLTLTKDKEKLQNINDAMSTFDDWLKDFDKKNLSKENRGYLPLPSIELLMPLKDKYKLDDEKADLFLAAYKKVKGEYKNLRTVVGGDDEASWDIVRNTNLKKIITKVEDDDADLWKDDLPTAPHMEMIVWAYSPDAPRIKKSLSKFEEKLGKPEKEEKKSSRRRSDSSSSNSDSSSEEETPKKRSKK